MSKDEKPPPSPTHLQQNLDDSKSFAEAEKAHAEMASRTNSLSAQQEGPNKVDTSGVNDYHGIDTRAIRVGENVVYERKVAIMNQALIDLGMGPFQWKIFAMTGFGWFVDNVSPIPFNL